MASNGLLQYAKKGKCRICMRVRDTLTKVKPVGEVRHGMATGHIWECINTKECDMAANKKIAENHPDSPFIKTHIEQGRYTEWMIYS